MTKKQYIIPVVENIIVSTDLMKIGGEASAPPHPGAPQRRDPSF